MLSDAKNELVKPLTPPIAKPLSGLPAHADTGNVPTSPRAACPWQRSVSAVVQEPASPTDFPWMREAKSLTSSSAANLNDIIRDEMLQTETLHQSTKKPLALIQVEMQKEKHTDERTLVVLYSLHCLDVFVGVLFVVVIRKYFVFSLVFFISNFQV